MIKYGIRKTGRGTSQRMKCTDCNREFSYKESDIVRRAVVTPDKHFPLADMGAISCLTQAIELVEPDIYVDLGDVGEWSHFSRHKYKGKEKPPLEFMLPDCDRDVKDVNEGMDIIDESLDKAGCREKYITEGNHDDWMNKFTQQHPFVDYRFKDKVRLDERGYTYYPMGKYLKIGKLHFYHGVHYGGQYHTANHLRRLGANVMYGHWHDIQQMTMTHMDGPIGAWSIGCLKDMTAEANPWLGNRKVNWSHAFAIVEWYGNEGNFTVDIVTIIDGKTCVWGQPLNGN